MAFSRALRSALALLVATSCTAPARAPAPPSGVPDPLATAPTSTPPWLPRDAAAGVDEPELVQLLADHWRSQLERDPLWATELGVHALDDRLDDPSVRAVEERRAEVHAFSERAQDVAGIGNLSQRDRTTLALLRFALRSEQRSAVCELHLWSLDPRSDVMTRYNRLADLARPRSEASAERLLARYRAVPAAIQSRIAALREGLRRGYVANAHSARLVADQIDAQLAEPLHSWALSRPAREPAPEWNPDFRERYATEIRSAVRDAIKPAYAAFSRFIREEVLPVARSKNRESLAHVPGGDECYRALIEAHTTLPLDARSLHQTGLDELARIHAEMLARGQSVFPGVLATAETPDDRLGALLRHLRESRDVHFSSAEQIEAAANQALEAANRSVQAFFGRLPATPCVVESIPLFEAANATIAYYQPPHADGSRPGRFMVNTRAPTTRTSFDFEALTFHESVPGHHLQIALGQELGELPAFRKHGFLTAFIEGWALYAEGLAEEMGLYSSELSVLGRLNFEAWRAARLVVDTGMHALGWTRDRAISFLLEQTALARNNVETEVDRYLVWPAQALAYKTGQLEISGLRRKAQQRLGVAFDVRGFHDAVLSSGAVTLPILRRQVSNWVNDASL